MAALPEGWDECPCDMPIQMMLFHYLKITLSQIKGLNLNACVWTSDAPETTYEYLGNCCAPNRQLSW